MSAASEQLRSEFGIYEVAPTKSAAGQYLCTAGELRALLHALGISVKQFGARFRMGETVIRHHLKKPPATPIYLRRADTFDKLWPVVQRAQELGLLVVAPGTRVAAPHAPGKRPTAKTPPRSEVVRFRCTACGTDLRKTNVLTDTQGDLYHEHEGSGCGPVRVEDRRAKVLLQAAAT